jgi:hypothetical protein
MTKSEALEFLELPETATDNEIKIRVEDKLAYFERLSEKAPSDFLRRLHARNAAKVSEIQMASRKWPSYVPPVQEQPEPASQSSSVTTQQPSSPDPVPQRSSVPEPLPKPEPESLSTPQPEAVAQPEAASTPESIPAQSDPLPELQTEPASGPELSSEAQSTPEFQPVTEPNSQQEPEPQSISAPDPQSTPQPEPAAIAQPIASQPEPASKPEPAVTSQAEPQPDPVAWLIRHTENQSSRTFPLYPGKNFLGRKPKEGLTPFLEVEEDPYISKVHAVLYAENGDIYISDPSGKEGNPSRNGIFINAAENRLMAKTRLWEKDTVQIGVTKLILRYNSKAIVKIVKEVEEQDYMHTVVIDIS